MNLLAEPLVVTRELKTMRKPLSAAITNDASLLAVLSTKHQANIYGLTESGVSHLQIVMLDNVPRTIALAIEGTVLAAAYEGGVEVFSLATNALSTDRRAVRCEAVDSLSFSSDGSMLVGSSHDTDDSNTVIITAPFYTENDPDLTTGDMHSRMWTTQILFPQNSSTCNHAALLNSHGEGDINWLFVYDRSLNTYRAVRADDTRTGVAYFLGPSPRRHSTALPDLLPSIDLSGELAVAGFSGLGLFMYGIPERVDNAPDMSHVLEREERSSRRLPASLTSATGYREPLMAYSPPLSQTETIEDDFLSGSVDWRRSLFVRSRQLASLEDAVGLIWVENLSKTKGHEIRRRLAVVAPGGVNEFAEEIGEEIMPVDGGRILLLDFEYASQGRERKTITIEVGEKVPEVLPEQRGNLDVEVALVRRRSIREAVDGSRRWSLSRSATAFVSPSTRMSTHLEDAGSRASMSQPSSPTDGPNGAGVIAASGDRSYRGQARLRESLQRSTTAVGINRARYPPRPPLDSVQGAASGHVVYRRTNERRALPNGTEVDDWEPPPPYSRNPDRTLLDSERLQMVPRNFPEPAHRSGEPYISPRRASTASGEMTAPSASFNNSRNLNDILERRRRGLSDSTLDSWVQPSPNLGPRRRSEHFSTIQSLPSSVSPISSPRSTCAPRSPPSEPSIRMAANIVSPMSDIPQPQRSPEDIGAHYATRIGGLSVVTGPFPVNENALTTLTGANLQNRLNHPVPPRPSQLSQEASPTYIPKALQVGKTAQPTILPPNSNDEPFSLAPPTSDQMAHLNKRVSRTRRRPVPISTSTHPVNAGSGRDFAPVPPSPPRAAWGAAGVPGSPSFNKASRSPQVMSRNNSRGSQRSASTPNLVSSRPRYGRLDTIDSVRSVHPQEERSRSRSQGMIDRSMLMDPLPSIVQQRAATHPKAAKSRKPRRADKDSADASRDGKKWRTNRCVVM